MDASDIPRLKRGLNKTPRLKKLLAQMVDREPRGGA